MRDKSVTFPCFRLAGTFHDITLVYFESLWHPLIVSLILHQTAQNLVFELSNIDGKPVQNLGKKYQEIKIQNPLSEFLNLPDLVSSY